jgi:hypothetical protein
MAITQPIHGKEGVEALSGAFLSHACLSVRTLLAPSKPEGIPLRVLADRPALARMDDAAAKRFDLRQRPRQVSDRKVRQRERVPGAGATSVDADRRSRRPGLPAAALIP